VAPQRPRRTVADIDRTDRRPFGNEKIQRLLAAQGRAVQPKVNRMPRLAKIDPLTAIRATAVQEAGDLVRFGQKLLDLRVRGRAKIANHPDVYGAGQGLLGSKKRHVRGSI